MNGARGLELVLRAVGRLVGEGTVDSVFAEVVDPDGCRLACWPPRGFVPGKLIAERALTRFGEHVGKLRLRSKQAPSRLDLGLLLSVRLLEQALETNYELEDLARAISRCFEERTLLYEITNEFTRSGHGDPLGNELARRLCEVTGGEKAFVVTCDTKRSEYSITGKLGLPGVSTSPLGFDVGLTGSVLRERAPVYVSDVLDFPPEGLSDFEERTSRDLLIVPILSCADNEPMGAFGVLDGPEGGFRSETEQMLEFLANFLATMIASRRLIELSKELQVATRIVESLLPQGAPNLPGFSMAGRLMPASHIGGDAYDFIPLADGSVAIVVADVSGHTLPAAMMMGNARNSLRWALRETSDLDRACARVADHLYEDLVGAGFFLSFAVAILGRDGTLRCASAGHPPLLLWRASSAMVESLDPEGMVVGVRREVIFEERQVQLKDGDVLLAYTDGVIEAGDDWPANPFGSERLERVLAENAHLSSEEIVAGVFRSLREFSLRPLRDDVTVVALRAGDVETEQKLLAAAGAVGEESDR